MAETWGKREPVAAHINPRLSVEVDPELGARCAQGVCACLCANARSDAATAGSSPPSPPVDADFDISVQRAMFDYTPNADKIHDRAFAARGMKRLDSWHLLEIAIDPAYEGKGGSQRFSA